MTTEESEQLDIDLVNFAKNNIRSLPELKVRPFEVHSSVQSLSIFPQQEEELPKRRRVEPKRGKSGMALFIISPTHGPTSGNTEVGLSGNGFVNGCTVDFDDTPATSVVFMNEHNISCRTPAHVVGLSDVTVTNPSGDSVEQDDFFTFEVTVTVTSVTPNSGSSAGGTAVTVVGTNFAVGATVKFGVSSATSVVVVNSTTITCVTPAHATGFVNVTVTNLDGHSGALVNGFNYGGTGTVDFVIAGPAPVKIGPVYGPYTLTASGFTGNAFIEVIDSFVTVFAFGGAVQGVGNATVGFAPQPVSMPAGSGSYAMQVVFFPLPNYGAGGFAVGNIRLRVLDDADHLRPTTTNGSIFVDIPVE